MAGIKDWLAVASEGSPDDLRERILTGFKDGKPFTPYRPTQPLPAPVGRVLDFGCGLGRNFPYLKEIASHVTGYDLPPMIRRCHDLAPAPVDELSADWPGLTRQRYDLIFSTLVLQHMEPEASHACLADFAAMAPLVYVLTRADSDFNTSVLEQIAAIGLFETPQAVEVEHDASTHQLRVIGAHALDDLVRDRRAGHYELLLHSRAR